MNNEIGGTPPAASRTSGLAIASLILGILSCLCAPAPVAIVLGIIALVQMGKDPSLKGKGFAIAGIALPIVMLPIFLMAAIAVPNFMKFQSRSKQSECRSNLKSISTAQRSREAEGEAFTDSFKKLEWSPELNNRYAYFMSSEPVAGESAIYATHKEGISEDKANEAARRELAGGAAVGLDPETAAVTIVCVGNIDSDDDVDVWSVSSADHEGPGGTIAAWELFNEWSDVTDSAGSLDSSASPGRSSKRIDFDD